MAFNPELLNLARQRVGLVKHADGPPGAMPQPQAAPPTDPTAGMPGGSPAGGAPPTALPPAPQMPMQDPSMMGGGMQAGGAKKMKPEEVTQSFRDFNTQVMLTAIINHLGIRIPPEALLTPPNPMGAPTPEQAMPGSGSPIDMATQNQGGQAGGQAPGGAAPGGDPSGQQSAIQPIDPVQPAMPQGGAPKTAQASYPDGIVGEPYKSPVLAANGSDMASRLRTYTQTVAAQ